jgi:alkylation response protein AidB-like acyl-CoA dehydrogenase
VREVTRDEDGFPRALYRQMAQLGWMGLAVPEAYGGAGMTLLDLALLLEQLGRALVPGPFFSSAVLATPAILQGGSSAQKKEWLPRLATGEASALAWLESDRSMRRRAARARSADIGSGQKMFVTDAHGRYIVAAFRTARAGVTLFLCHATLPATVKPYTA